MAGGCSWGHCSNRPGSPRAKWSPPGHSAAGVSCGLASSAKMGPMSTDAFEAMRDKAHNAHGFIAALDQSGGSSPKALKLYGVGEDEYGNDAEMFDRIHEMRTRIITSPS